MIKLIITDMDGTFLDDKKKYNTVLFDQVKKMTREQGITFAVCTGKQTQRVEEIFDTDYYDFYIIADSAARIKHQHKFIYQSLLDNALGLKIIASLISINEKYAIIVSTENGAFTKNNIPPHIHKRLNSAFSNLKLITNYSDLTEDFIKITVYDEHGDCIRAESRLSNYKNKAYIVASESQWLDITNYGVHKGTTVAKLQNMLGVNEQETMIFGDGLNDIELMDQGTFSFAMENGCDQTKAAANYIIGSNNDDSVLRTIIQILNLQA
jgi:Cof subfamily protein (haloacid dehalogenase superfamily)